MSRPSERDSCKRNACDGPFELLPIQLRICAPVQIASQILYYGVMNTTPQSNDFETSLDDLKSEVRQFSEERDWQQFHSPKNLSMSLAIETAELMEHFQWISMEDSRSMASDPEKKAAVSEELADVFCYTLAIANEMGIDLSSAFHNKMKKNRLKYPTKEFKGRYGADDPKPANP